jgi:hypothetical protein
VATDLDKTESVLLIGAVGVVVYLLYKGWASLPSIDEVTKTLTDLGRAATEAPPGDLPATAPSRQLPINADPRTAWKDQSMYDPESSSTVGQVNP